MRLSALAALLLVALATACSPVVGTACDESRAREVVYDTAGQPAYAGQSLLITTCAGGGSFCHADMPRSRYGAPYGMNFDVTLADNARFATEAQGAMHLYAAQLETHVRRDDIFSQVSSGAMPPGAVGDGVALHAYVDASGHAVPSIRSGEGRELLRNWLACGSPVVEATMDPMPRPCTTNAQCTITHRCDTAHSECFGVGAVEPVLSGSLTAHWSSIYPGIVQPTCVLGPCHSAAGAPGAGMLDLSSASAAYSALVGHASVLSGCGMRVMAGNPDRSLLAQKLGGTQPATCGSAMPIGSMLPANQIALVRTWIMNGALND